MSTTIDSLQIEIQSSSTNAAKGIDALAKSLEGLKKNGSFKTVSTNLNNLSAALNKLPNVHSASNALRTLANSIEKLKSVGTVSGLSNSLTKLPTALKSLGNINLDRVKPQIQGVVDAVEPLSRIKTSGFSSMVNAMKNLGKVADSLDEGTIGRFAEKVKILDEKLGPLSTKMANIKSGFNAINSSARSATRSVSDFGEGVNTTTLNMASMITVAQGVIAALQPLIRIVTESVHQASQWDGIKYQFGNAFGEQADEYYQKITKITEALDINKQSFMENSAMAASMLIGFGVDRADAREMGLGYTELAYDIWAAFNNVYETLDGADGAMAAVRSAIAGEVEPIRRAGFTIVESTLEQTAANHGLSISIETATEAQKSYLRYLALVDQAQGKGVIGTYAREMNTAEGMMRTFSQQVKSLSQAFGSLFLPILVKVMPYLQAFVELLAEGVRWLAGLFGVEIQDISDGWNDYSSGVGEAVDNTENVTGALGDAVKAAKELKNASIGIDELNVISPNAASGVNGGGAGGGAGGGGFSDFDIDSLWNDSIFDSIQNKVDDLKSKLKGMFDDWLPTLQVIGGALAGWSIASLLGQLGDALKLGDDFAGKVTTIKKLAASAIIIAIQFKLMGDSFENFMGEDGTILDYIEGVLIGAASTYLLYKQWGVGGLAIGLGVTAAVSLKTVIDSGGITDMESAVVAITGLASAIGAFAFAGKALADAGKAIKSSAAVSSMIEFFAAAKQMAPDVGWLAALFPKLSTALAGLPAALSSAATALAAAAPYIAIAAAVVGGIVLAFVDYDFSEIGHTLGKKLGEALRNTGAWIADVGVSIWDGMKSAFAWLKTSLDIEDFWDVLKVLFVPGELLRRIGPEIEELFDGISEWINDKIENLKGNINEFFGGFFDGLFEGLGVDMSWAEKFTEIFDIEYLDIVNIAMNPQSIGKYIMNGINTGIDSNAKLSAIKDKLSSMWENAKTWWNEKKGALSSYTPSIGNIASRLSSAWTDAKNWWNEKRSSLSYTPSIGKIWEKLKSAWTSAKDWWNKSRSSLSYTPTIGSISSKLSSAWTTAKNWWNKSRSSLSYTPSIGSIKDKIVSAWNSAKSWWKNNVGSLSTKIDIKVPTISINWKTVDVLGKSFRYPTGFNVKFAANGGIFDQGSLIWAGERGPEVMATAAGGKTGVMNVQQMQDAVYEGVYAAISAAMRGNGNEGGAQAVNVYLDGKVIAKSVEKAQRERGASIMGNAVYSY